MKSRRKTPSQVREELVDRVHVEGVPAAFEALLAICRDQKAPAPARANAAATVVRMAGFFRKPVEPDDHVEPHEMTRDQLDRALARSLAKLRRGEPDAEGGDEEEDDEELEDEDDPDGSVFG